MAVRNDGGGGVRRRAHVADGAGEKRITRLGNLSHLKINDGGISFRRASVRYSPGGSIDTVAVSAGGIMLPR